MTVIDASVVVDALLRHGDRAGTAREELGRHEPFDTTEMFLAEVASGVRSLVARNQIAERRALEAISWAARLSPTTHSLEGLLPRVWELRHVLSVYDAWYIALAEALETEVLTLDKGMQRAPGVRCTVRPPED